METSTGPTTNSASGAPADTIGEDSTDATDTPGTSAGAAGFGAAETPAPEAVPAGAAARPPFRLVRSRSDRMLGGVCGGLGRTLGVDPAVLRIGLVVLTVLGAGAGAIIYLAAWILAPEEDMAG